MPHRFRYIAGLLALQLSILIACKDGSSDPANIFGTWVVQKARIEDNSALPSSLKTEMEAKARGQVWQINPDSTIVFRNSPNGKADAAVHFRIENKDGHTLLIQGSDAVELKNQKGKEMDIVMSQGITMTIHLLKQ